MGRRIKKKKKLIRLFFDDKNARNFNTVINQDFQISKKESEELGKISRDLKDSGKRETESEFQSLEI